MKLEARIVEVGTWVYGGAVEKSVRVVQQNWDYYYEEGFSEGMPHLSPEGYAFYIVYGPPLPPETGSEYCFEGYLSRSRTCLSREDAIRLAEKTIDGPITWGRLPKSES